MKFDHFQVGGSMNHRSHNVVKGDRFQIYNAQRRDSATGAFGAIAVWIASRVVENVLQQTRQTKNVTTFGNASTNKVVQTNGTNGVFFGML